MTTNIALPSPPNNLFFRNSCFPCEDFKTIITGLRSFIEDIKSIIGNDCKVNDLFETPNCSMYIHILYHEFLDDNNQLNNNQLTRHFNKIDNVCITIRFYKKNKNDYIIEIQREFGDIIDFSLFIRKFRIWMKKHYNYNLKC
jgi:hypothetical protein